MKLSRSLKRRRCIVFFANRRLWINHCIVRHF
jgi:hypothetical protein